MGVLLCGVDVFVTDGVVVLVLVTLDVGVGLRDAVGVLVFDKVIEGVFEIVIVLDGVRDGVID